MKFPIVQSAMELSNQVWTIIVIEHLIRMMDVFRYCILWWSTSRSFSRLRTNCKELRSKEEFILFFRIGLWESWFSNYYRYLSTSGTLQSSDHIVRIPGEITCILTLFLFSVDKDCPRLLINMEAVGKTTSLWDMVNIERCIRKVVSSLFF